MPNGRREHRARRKRAPRALRNSSSAMIAAPIAAPAAIIPQGNPPPNMPFATDAISVACGASSGFGCAADGTPMPYAFWSRFKIGAITNAHDTAPIAIITCCRHGVAPTIWPALRSWRLSPATAAAQQTTAPIMIAAIGAEGEPRPRSKTSTSEANKIVAIVMPETGLFDEPTMPAM